jgi:CheY-like chemotaxis protein
MQNNTELSILIISDEPGVTRVLLAIFRALEVTRLTVVGALDVPAYDRYDLAVIANSGDVSVALDAADRVRRRDDKPGPHIVLLSVSRTEELERLVQWGRIDALMLKPVTIAGLTTQIEHAIERRARG